MKINLSYGIFLIFGIFLASYVLCTPVLAQLPSATGIGVKIDTPADSANLPVGDLTIYGTSSDSNTTNCQVFADWNDLKPMQKVTANGPRGISDYSKWSFTYTGSYHGIAEGANELTSKITCYEQGQNASSKSYSINVTGIAATNEITNNSTQKSTEIVHTKVVTNEDNNILPVISNISNTDSTNNTVQSTEIVDTKDVANEDVANEDVANEDVAVNDAANEDVAVNDAANEDVAVNDAANEDNNILPVISNISDTDSISNPAQSTQEADVDDVDNEQVASEGTNALPINNNKNNGTYKILPLYSESDEESSKSASSENPDQADITNMNTVGSQDEITSTQTIEPSSGTYYTFSSDQKGTIGEENNLGMTSNGASDEGLTSPGESNTFFTYEPDLIEDSSTQNNVNTFGTKSDTVSSFSNHKVDDNSIFGLKFNGLDNVAQNKIEKRIEKLENSISDRISMFDLIG
ncbi:MAG TPA: hypothetical protein VE594_05830 [Nitrososphaeraceae archaeon]|nr:hypothetical protein [Nitrososphaeraceae archaeon]